jgi:hypothetical protein
MHFRYLTAKHLRDAAEYIANSDYEDDEYSCIVIQHFAGGGRGARSEFNDLLLEMNVSTSGSLSYELAQRSSAYRNKVRVMFLLFMAEVLEDNAL